MLVDDLRVLLILGFEDVLVHSLGHLWCGMTHTLRGVLVRHSEDQHRGSSEVTEIVEASGNFKVLAVTAVSVGDAIGIQRDDPAGTRVCSMRLDDLVDTLVHIQYPVASLRLWRLDDPALVVCRGHERLGDGHLIVGEVGLRERADLRATQAKGSGQQDCDVHVLVIVLCVSAEQGDIAVLRDLQAEISAGMAVDIRSSS